MGQTIKQRACQAFGAEGFGPFLKGQIAGDKCRALLIALRDQLERHRQVVALSLSFSEQPNLSECNFTRDIMPDGKSI